MTASTLQAAVLLLTLASAAVWGVAAIRIGRGVGVLVAFGALLTALQVIAVAVLWTNGWWFVQEKVVLGLPLVVTATAAAGVLTVRDRAANRQPGPGTRTSYAAAAYASGAGLVLQLGIGYPLTLIAAGVVTLLVVGSTAATWFGLAPGTRRPFAAITSTLALVAVAALGSAWIVDRGAPSLAASGHHGASAGAEASALSTADTVPTVSVTELRTPATVEGMRVALELEARQQRVELPSGRSVNAWTFGELPGPLIEVTEGEVVEVALRNRDIDSGVTVHWHGYDVPNGEDGVAGVTQDAVLPGEEFHARFVADQPGTYWYHTHQRSSDGVSRGLYGALIVHPLDAPAADLDLALPLHTISGITMLGGSDGLERRTVPAGWSVRARLINTDQVTRTFTLGGTPFRVAAIDGTELNAPGPIVEEAVRVAAGGRYDLMFEMPESPVRLSVEGSRDVGVLFEPRAGGDDPGAAQTARVFDPLSYGEPADVGDLTGPADVRRTLVLDRLPRLLEGMPGYAYTIDGLVAPHIPPTEVAEGDLVHLRIVNRGFETHPMHPHGHHVLVLAVDGRAPAGSPIWLDTFDVQPGEVWEVALRADNPGIWMDHCHNLEHAAQGMVTHLAYDNVVSPFRHGGMAGNEPE